MHAEDGRRGNALQQEGLSRLLSEVQGPVSTWGLCLLKGASTATDGTPKHLQAWDNLADPLKTSKNV